MNKITCILILLTFLIMAAFGQKPQSKPSNYVLRSSVSTDFDLEHFKAFPHPLNDRFHLIDKIKPSAAYAYWECVFKDPIKSEKNRGEVIVYNGDRKYASLANKANPSYGFFVECHPGICFSYIVAVRTDKTLDIIDSETLLKKFIGRIDNLEEVILMAKINGYWFDTDTLIGGAYREREKDYLLYLLDYSSTPETYQSVKAILTKDGDFRVIDKKIYKQTDDYIWE